MANLDPNRITSHVVIDYTDEIGIEGVYIGSFDDCQEFISEQGDAIGYDIVLNVKKK